MEVKGTPHELPDLLLCAERGPPPRPGALPCRDAVPMAASPAVQVCPCVCFSALLAAACMHHPAKDSEHAHVDL